MPNATVAMTISRVSFAKALSSVPFLASSLHGMDARSPDVVRDFASLSVSRRELQYDRCFFAVLPRISSICAVLSVR